MVESKTMPSVDNLLKLSELFHVHMEDLLARKFESANTFKLRDGVGSSNDIGFLAACFTRDMEVKNENAGYMNDEMERQSGLRLIRRMQMYYTKLTV